MSYEMVWAVPCRHPAAVEGLFYCVPSYFNSGHRRENFEFLMVETQKTVAKLRRENPVLLAHADHQFNGTTVAEWLEHMAPSAPLDMGHWSYNHVTGLGMSYGQVAMIALVQVLDLRCFPIAVSKAVPVARRNELRDAIGHDEGHPLAPRGSLAKFLHPVPREGGRPYFVPRCGL
jgi:hypothetical protein